MGGKDGKIKTSLMIKDVEGLLKRKMSKQITSLTTENGKTPQGMLDLLENT